jgi:hypothetical protein
MYSASKFTKSGKRPRTNFEKIIWGIEMVENAKSSP